MPSYRIPRGYAVKRPYYQEICEGVRPTPQAVPMEAWTGLPAVSIDELTHDPIVIEAGTVVGVCPDSNPFTVRRNDATIDDGNVRYLASGKIVPATAATGCTCVADSTQNTAWGLQSSYHTHDFGWVKPIGVCTQPVYSFYLNYAYTNYKRSYYVGVVTDYVIQIPAVWTGEHGINAGDFVRVCDGTGYEYPTNWNIQEIAGRYKKAQIPDVITIPSGSTWAAPAAGADGMIWSGFASTLLGDLPLSEFVVGRCLAKLTFAYGGTYGHTFSTDVSSATVKPAATSEFGGLSKVQTVPGLGTAGSATKGVPGWLMGARADSLGEFHALTILVRL